MTSLLFYKLNSYACIVFSNAPHSLPRRLSGSSVRLWESRNASSPIAMHCVEDARLCLVFLLPGQGSSQLANDL